MKDYYYILGLTETASKDAIKTAYRKLTKKFHPDMNDGDKFFEDRFKEIQEAYEILTDDIKRSNYDFNRRNRGTNSTNNKSDSDEQNQNFQSSKNTAEPVKAETSSSGSATKFLIGIGVLVVCSVIFLIGRNDLYNNNQKIISKPKAICNCHPILSTKNIEIYAHGEVWADIYTYIKFDYDTLIGGIDSVEIKECEINKRFDEDVEDIKNKYTHYYRSGKLIRSNKKDALISATSDKENKAITFYNDKNQLIKEVFKKTNDDSTMTKYLYENCGNSNLSLVKVYDTKGENIAECRIYYNDEKGSISLSTFIKDHYSMGGDYGLSKEINRFEIEIDSSCKIKRVREIYFEYGSIGQPRYYEQLYDSNGLVIETSDYMMREEEKGKKTEIKYLPDFLDINSDHPNWYLLGSDKYEYQYDKRGNWIVKKSNSSKIIRRNIYYHNKSS